MSLAWVWVPQVWSPGGCGVCHEPPLLRAAQPGGPFGMAGGARGWVAGRAGSWVFYLLPFGVGGSGPHIPGHPTSMCDLSVN